MAFRYLPHTADIKFEADGATLQEAFSEAARAVTHVMTDEVIRDERSYPVSLRADSVEGLLFAFLDEVIHKLDAEGLFVARASLAINQTDGSWVLSGELYGDDAASYERHGDVKAPTWHDMRVERAGGGWKLRATLDI